MKTVSKAEVLRLIKAAKMVLIAVNIDKRRQYINGNKRQAAEWVALSTSMGVENFNGSFSVDGGTFYIGG